MNKHNQDGALNVLLLPLIIAVVLFASALGFGVWANGERSKYKNDTDAIVQTAVTETRKDQSAIDAKQYAEAAKQPLKTFSGPSQYGSLKVAYPKTWSAYVATTGNSDGLLDGYFQPDTVPTVTDDNNSFALRIKVVQQAYSEVVKGFDGQAGITVTPYSLPKVPNTTGVRIVGQIEDNKQGDMIILPLRDTTVQIYTESKAYQNDFNTSILPNLTFVP